jgi:hypothetical protein
MSEWRDMVVGARMTVDSEFAPRIDDSPFSRQEWGLIMTAISFEIADADDETAARIVADTSELPTMMPELENVANMGPMGQPQGGDSGGGGGLLDSVFDAIGLGGGGDDGDEIDEEKLQAAEALVDAYAEELQAHLEAEGRWGEVRAVAAGKERGA